MPVSSSKARTLPGGQRFHCPTACGEIRTPSVFNPAAIAAGPPRAAIAAFNSDSDMAERKHSYPEKTSITFDRPRMDKRKQCFQKERMQNESNSLGKLLRAERKARRWTQTYVGNHLGLTRSAVGQWERGETTPEPEHVRGLIALFRFGSLIIHGDGTVQVSNSSLKSLPGGVMLASQDLPPKGTLSSHVRPANVPLLDPTSFPKDVPVLYTALSSESSRFLIGDRAIDYVRRPPGIANAEGVASIYVVDDSMSPRFRPGELVYLSSTRPPAKGEYVVVELNTAEKTPTEWPAEIREFVSWTPTSAVCLMYNPSRQVEIPRDSIRRVWRVIPWNEVIGL